MIYCNVTDCKFRNELAEPHKRDSMIPVTYTGYCMLAPGHVEMRKREFVSKQATRRVEAICETYSKKDDELIPFEHEERMEGRIACDFHECWSNRDSGYCERDKYTNKEDIYVSPDKMYYGNEEGIFPVCTSKSQQHFAGHRDWSQYPKR